MVLLHGVQGRWQTYLPVMPALTLRWHVFALDLRGHARSGRVPGRYRIVDYADDVAAFLRQRASGPAVVVGHSLGGYIAIRLAGAAPDLVARMVLEDPGLEDPAFDSPQRLAAQLTVPPMVLGLGRDGRLGPVGGRAPAPARRVAAELDATTQRSRAAQLSQLDPGTLAAALDQSLFDGYDEGDLLGRISCPVLLLQGDVALGGALSDAAAAQAAGRLADCAHVRVVGAGHGIKGAQPAAYVRLVNEFLESL